MSIQQWKTAGSGRQSQFQRASLNLYADRTGAGDKRGANAAALAWLQWVNDEDLSLSASTIGAIPAGIDTTRDRDAERACEIEVRLEAVAGMHYPANGRPLLSRLGETDAPTNRRSDRRRHDRRNRTGT